MPIGTAARQWFTLKYGKDYNKTYSSKFYTEKQSWPKIPVWWIQIPSSALDSNLYDHVNILCQVAPSDHNFHVLRVPVKYFNDHKDSFHKITGKISIYLSADPQSLFMEKRGTAELDFSKFLIK